MDDQEVDRELARAHSLRIVKMLCVTALLLSSLIWSCEILTPCPDCRQGDYQRGWSNGVKRCLP